MLKQTHLSLWQANEGSNLTNFFQEAIESQALHEVSEKELLQKTSNTLNRLKIWVQVRHL